MSSRIPRYSGGEGFPPAGDHLADGEIPREYAQDDMIWNYYIYILANKGRTVLYTGVTNSLVRRLRQHREGRGSRFAHRYNANRMVLWEGFLNVRNAIRREKEIKGWRREKKLALIESKNPDWQDYGETMLGLGPPGPSVWFRDETEEREILRAYAQEDLSSRIPRYSGGEGSPSAGDQLPDGEILRGYAQDDTPRACHPESLVPRGEGSPPAGDHLPDCEIPRVCARDDKY